jgi:hypothetical protein
MRFIFESKDDDKNSIFYLVDEFRGHKIKIGTYAIEMMGANDYIVVKIRVIVTKMEQLQKIVEETGELARFFSFKIVDNELKLHNGSEPDYEEKVLERCKELNMFENTHKLLQIVAFLNSDPEKKTVKRKTNEKVRGKNVKKVSTVIYVSKKAELNLVNGTEKRQYQRPRYAFRVRGHLRHLKSARYKTDNKEVFIKNYIKNTDKEIFINKEYKI